MIFTRIYVALIVLLFPLGVLAAGIQEADQAFRQGQYPVALERINAFLAGNAKDAQGRFMKGLILTELNRYPDAIKVFSGLTEDFPELPEPYNNLAVLYAAQGQYDQAKQSLEMAIRTHPSYATAHENLGDIYAKMASQSYDKALQLDRTNTSAQTKLSLIKELFNPTPRASEPAVKTAAKVSTAKPIQVAQASEAATPKTVESEKPGVPAAEPAPVADPVAEATRPSANDPAPVTYDNPVKMVQAWAEAWSRKDVPAYLAFYASSFKTPRGKDLAGWKAERKERIERAKSIRVEVSQIKVKVKGSTAKLKFRQHYSSNLLGSDSRKTLVLKRVNGGWLIVEER